MCRSCGAIVGAGEAQCAVCAAPSASQLAQSQPQPPADRETVRFARAILNRPYKFTVILLIANLFVFLLMWESSGVNSQTLWQGFPHPVLATYGAKQNYLIAAPYYQWWRLVAPMFIHINLPHLLVNMFSLWMIGPYVEKLYGSAKFVVFWVFSGILSFVASYLAVRPDLAVGPFSRFLFRSTDLPAAGASGALFGLVGVLFVFGLKFRRELPEGFKRAFGVGMVPIIIINLIIGFLGQAFIDNAAHIGGLVAGAGLALAAEYRRPGELRSISPVWRVLQAASLIIVVAGIYKVVRNFNRPVPSLMQHLARTPQQQFFHFVGVMNLLQEQVQRVIHNNDVSHVELVSRSALQTAAPDPQAAELRDRLLVILSKLTQASRNQQRMDQGLTDEFKKWHEDYMEWFKGAH